VDMNLQCSMYGSMCSTYPYPLAIQDRTTVAEQKDKGSVTRIAGAKGSSLQTPQVRQKYVVQGSTVLSPKQRFAAGLYR